MLAVVTIAALVYGTVEIILRNGIVALLIAIGFVVLAWRAWRRDRSGDWHNAGIARSRVHRRRGDEAAGFACRRADM